MPVFVSARTRAHPLSLSGQIAAKTDVEINCFCLMTLGLVPFVAHCLLKLPCWPILLSSCHQTSIWSFLICFVIFSTSSGKLSLKARIASSEDLGCFERPEIQTIFSRSNRL